MTGVYPCCQVEENLEPRAIPAGAPEGLELRVCRECDRRHFEMTVDPVELGVTFT